VSQHTLWVVVGLTYVFDFTARHRRAAAIEAWTGDDNQGRRWAYWRRRGYRCLKATLEVRP